MRIAMGWAAALVVAAGCGGGSGGGETTAAVDEHRGQDAACGACEVAAAGRIQGTVGSGGLVSVTATPAGAAPGSGFGGVGVAASGAFEFRSGSTTPGRPPLVGAVDTIVACTRTNGVLVATLSGAVVSGATGDIVVGTRLTVVATDGEGAGADSIAVSVGSFVVPPSPVIEGGIGVHHLDGCEATCAAGQCACPADPMVCEPCHGPDGEPAGNDPGHGMDPGAGAGGGTGSDGTGAGTGGAGGTVGDGSGGSGGTGGTGGTPPGGGGTGGSGPFIPL
jgi:hypothetical protein